MRKPYHLTQRKQPDSGKESGGNDVCHNTNAEWIQNLEGKLSMQKQTNIDVTEEDVIVKV